MDADMVDETADTPERSAALVDAVDDAADGVADGVDAIDTSDIDVPALIAERDSLRDLAQRIQADFENYRKRVTTQIADDVDRATGRIAESLLAVLDACEAAFVSNPAAIEPLFNLLLGELKKQGLEVLNLEGQPFDPAVAEAVMHEAGEGDSVVVEVLRTGYTWKGRVLRAAMVKVRG
ncbi:MAG: nucleotide exchange factor GrpE [Ilumatobacteraceae bacterium]